MSKTRKQNKKYYDDDFEYDDNIDKPAKKRSNVEQERERIRRIKDYPRNPKYFGDDDDDDGINGGF